MQITPTYQIINPKKVTLFTYINKLTEKRNSSISSNESIQNQRLQQNCKNKNNPITQRCPKTNINIKKEDLKQRDTFALLITTNQSQKCFQRLIACWETCLHA